MTSPALPEPAAASPATLTCPDCGTVTRLRIDIDNQYCASCRWWTSDPVLGPVRRDAVKAGLGWALTVGQLAGRREAGEVFCVCGANFSEASALEEHRRDCDLGGRGA